jgi:hypothetical protein
MHRIGVKERVFVCVITLCFFVLVVSLLALTIAEDPVGQRHRHKPKPMLGVVSPSN